MKGRDALQILKKAQSKRTRILYVQNRSTYVDFEKEIKSKIVDNITKKNKNSLLLKDCSLIFKYC